MKYAPCDRFATRIRPKMSENPDESRNRSPPSASPFSDWMSQNRTGLQLLLEVRRFRGLARVHRLRQERLRIVLPELRDVRVRLDDGVLQAPVLALPLADVDRHDGIAVLVDLDRPAEALGDVERAQRLHEAVLVLDLSFHFLQSQ